MSQPITKNKLKVWKLSKLVDSMERLQCSPLWPIYIGEKGRTLGKTCGIKVRCYWEHPGGTHWKPREHIENLMGIHWELEGNMLETKEKRKKKSSPPFQNLKEKKSRHFEWVHAEPCHWLHAISMFQNRSSLFLAWANTPHYLFS